MGTEQKRIKIIQPTDWSFQPMDDYISSGGDAFSVSRFGYECFGNKGVDVDYVTPDYSKWYTKFLKNILKLEGCNLVLQCQLIKRSRKYDVIYYSADRHPYLLALARKLRLVKTPILMLCHFSYDTRTVDSSLKKMALKIERKLVFTSMDQILFNCKTLMDLAIEDGKLPSKHRKLSGWGADLNYFSKGERGRYQSWQPFYFAAGGANRDYHTIIEAFRRLPYNLVISCPRSVIEEESSLPPNIIFFDYQKYGLDVYDKLRCLYHDCKAVLIPIMYRNHVANGASVFAEALASGKPLIVSDLKTNFLDVEKEHIGYKVALQDVNGWIKVIENFEELLDFEIDQMGHNAAYIASTRHNYEFLASNIVLELKQLLKQKGQSNC